MALAKISSNFGNHNRHHIFYDFKENYGYLQLYSWYCTALFNDGARCERFYFSGRDDIISLLLGLKLVVLGKSHGFANYKGVFIKLSRGTGDSQDIISVLGEGQSTGKLEIDGSNEVETLELILKDILVKLGISYIEIEKSLTF